MVGTIEPRKGYSQTISAFEQLWKDGHDINLVIVGREGWIGLPDSMRTAVLRVVTQLRNSPELGQRLLWLEGISDEYLNKIYARSTCLIAASEGEGFGLPLIEAAQHKIPMMVRDIPIFREVAGAYAYYFNSFEPQQMSRAIDRWLELNKIGQTPASSDMPWITWKQSVKILVEKIGLTGSTPNDASG
jgi:glycosyltransferase involved in cell wall biosynthesis